VGASVGPGGDGLGDGDAVGFRVGSGDGADVGDRVVRVVVVVVVLDAVVVLVVRVDVVVEVCVVVETHKSIKSSQQSSRPLLRQALSQKHVCSPRPNADLLPQRPRHVGPAVVELEVVLVSVVVETDV